MAYFDHFAKTRPTGLGARMQDLYHESVFLRISRMVKKDSDILEIGPGKGEIARLFIKSGYKKYDAVEPNPKMRSDLEKLGARKVKGYMIPELKEDDKSYDLIMIFDVFEHLNDAKEAQRFISEAERVLRKGGHLAIISPDLMDWGMDFWNCDFSHSNPTSVRRALQMFYNAGIEPVTYCYYYNFSDSFFGFLVSRIVQLATSLSLGNSLQARIYKLRLSFLRRFLIIGLKR